MLRGNLATRPFYNEGAVYVALGIVAVAGLVVLGSGVRRVLDLSQQSATLTSLAEEAEREEADLTARTVEVQRVVSPQALEEIEVAVREANSLIEQRVFSWTEFFNRIETTLPPGVMLTEVRPDIESGSIEVTMGVMGRGLDAISEFILSLEDSGAFNEVLNVAADLTDNGMYRAVLSGHYLSESPSDYVLGAELELGAGDVVREDSKADDSARPNGGSRAGPDAEPGVRFPGGGR